MSLTNASLQTGATGITVTAGSALALSLVAAAPGKAELAALTDSQIARRSVSLSATEGQLYPQAQTGYTQNRRNAIVRTPVSKTPPGAASAVTTLNTAKIQLAFDVQSTDAEVLELKMLACQAIMDSDFDGFWRNGITTV